MHHKRRRQKNRRAGCLACKPWKISGVHPESAGAEKPSDHSRRIHAREDMRDWRDSEVGLEKDNGF